MRHAYLITVHKNFHILELLINLLDSDEVDFYICLDKKYNRNVDEIISLHPLKSKVTWIEQICINWGAYSQIEAELRLLNAAIPNEYDYYHFMQGSDFPIKSRDEINRFFEKNNGYEFIDYAPTNYEFAKYKCNYWHITVNSRFYRNNIILKAINHGLIWLQKRLDISREDRQLFHGSAFWSISHKCALYITGKEEEIKKRYNWCLAADEVFLQTEVYHSPFRNSLYHFEGENGNLRLIDWTRREGSSPHTFTIKDIELIEKQANAMFARKFDEENMEIIDYLYQKLKV